MTQEAQAVKDQTIDIIIAPAENITESQYFQNDIIFQVIPVRTD